MNRLSTLPEDMIYEITARTPVSDWENQMELFDFTFDIHRLIGMTGRAVEEIFTEAVEEGASTIVELMLQETDIDPTTLAINPLVLAVNNCHARVVTLLLEHGNSLSTTGGRKTPIDPNYNNNYALRQAASDGCLPVVHALLSDSRTIPDIQALYNAVGNNHTEVVQYLLDDGRFDPAHDDQEILRYASIEGHAYVVRVLLQDERVIPKNRHLIDAAGYGHLEVLKVFIEDGRLDPNVFNNEALYNAIISGHEEIVSYLLEQERVLDQDLSSILMSAIEFNMPNVARVVIKVQSLTEQQLRDAAVEVVKRQNWEIGELLSPLL